jgi:hypothetical protein
MKRFLIFIFSALLFFNNISCVFAENPLSVPNNLYGIHITDEKDLDDASKLVNSSGGDWGYVTLVVTEADRNHDRFQQIFDSMRRLHLIPIIRIATKANGDIWEAPNEAEINNWIAFLNSLNWVIQNRYIVIYNEPNHSSEWGGTIDPEAYANMLNNFAIKLHQASNDFFILPAGLDASATKTASTMDEKVFLKRMLTEVPNLFDNLDGWVSHSYPNPAFSGKETDTGRGTIDTFNWEMSYLKTLGIEKDLPIFITETGWSNKNVDLDNISEMLTYAYKNVWNDQRIVTVTPFILNYPQEPFSEFSWKKEDGTFYPFYKAIQKIPKNAGKPVQIVSGQIIGAIAQPIVISGSNFGGAILARNTGQSIWSMGNINVSSDTKDLFIESFSFPDTEPTKLGLIVFKASLQQSTGFYNRSIFLSDNLGKRMTNSFPIEGIITRIDKMQIGSFFVKIGSYLQNSLNLKF